MNKDSKILVAGAKGMVGSAIVRNLRSKGYYVIEATRDKVDFTDQEETKEFFERNNNNIEYKKCKSYKSET